MTIEQEKLPIFVCTKKQWLDYCKETNTNPDILILNGMEVKFLWEA